VKIVNYIGAYILSIPVGWLIAGSAVYLMRLTITPLADGRKTPRDSFRLLDLWVGGVERAVATTLILLAPRYLPGFIGGWVVLKFAANWQRRPYEAAVAEGSLVSLVGSVLSFTVAIAAGLLVRPDALAILAK